MILPRVLGPHYQGGKCEDIGAQAGISFDAQIAVKSLRTLDFISAPATKVAEGTKLKSSERELQCIEFVSRNTLTCSSTERTEAQVVS